MSRLLLILCLSAPMAAACRMADGPVPDTKVDDVPNQLGDIGRDLGGVVNGDPQARQDFVDDLMVFVRVQEAEAPVKQLAAQVVDAVVATKPSESAVAPLVEHLYVAITARELSESQVKTLQSDVQADVSRLGLDDVKARALGAQVGIVQQAVTARHRRWYEVF
jgi:hypothetical protein